MRYSGATKLRHRCRGTFAMRSTSIFHIVFAMALPMVVAGCSTTSDPTSALSSATETKMLSTEIASASGQISYASAYAATEDTGILMPAFEYQKQKERFLRREVGYSGSKPPGSIVIDTQHKFLYFVMPNKRAIRYGIAVGKEGHEWSGDAVMQWKQKWPTWTPPPEMIQRKPELEEFADGMLPGVENPLGARALYLYKDVKDTLYRIHGTNRPFSIGHAASSGCFRMVNQDVIDLYGRVSKGAKVFMRHALKIREDI